MPTNLGLSPTQAQPPPGGRRRARPAEAAGTQAYRFKHALKEARTGLIESQYQVGLMLATGAGTRKSLAEALGWMNRAAERGHAAAQFMLGCHFAAEPGTAPRGQLDEARAMEWLYLASRQGHARANHRLAQLLRQSATALSAHHEAAAASLGLAESQLALARQQLRADADADLYSSGRAWLKRAADQGLAAAQTAWGIHCLNDPAASGTWEEGLQWLQAAAAQGWPPALLELHQRGQELPALAQAAVDPIDPAVRFALGQLHALGVAGLPVNPQQASHWWTLAASQNWPAAHTALGQLAQARDERAARAHYLAGAQAGDAEAQYALSRLLRADPTDQAAALQAHRWLVMAAEAGHAHALLDWSEGLERAQADEAQLALHRAAEAGLPEAQFRWALHLLKQPGSTPHRDALHWLEQAVAQGHPAARSRLGLALLSGPAEQRDVMRGLQLLQEAADDGEPAAQWNLALLLAAGAHHLPQDAAAALSQCRLAADSGFVPALATMGLLCATLDRPEEAVHWWRQAAHAGDLEAKFNLARAFQAGRGVQRDASLSFHWLLQAAQDGLAQAQTELGIFYATGLGTAVDPIESHKWFYLARLCGSPTAVHNIEKSRRLLRPDQIEEGERRARTWRALQRRHD